LDHYTNGCEVDPLNVGMRCSFSGMLKLGYNRAGRIVDQLEAAGVLGALKAA
jgi:hypothetical protein